MNYAELFYGCFEWDQTLRTTFTTYLTTLNTSLDNKLHHSSLFVHSIHLRTSLKMQIVLFWFAPSRFGHPT